MNTYVLVEVIKNYLTEVEVAHAKSFREALIAFDFGPYDAWEDFASFMEEDGLITAERLEDLCAAPDKDVAQAVADYAVEHWNPTEHYILEIKSNGSVTTWPELQPKIAGDVVY